MTPEQKDAIDKARTAAINLKKQADKARALGLTVLEQWLRESSVGCMAGADFQTRAMGDNLATQTERVVLDKNPNVTQDDITKAKNEANALADAMNRRFEPEGKAGVKHDE